MSDLRPEITEHRTWRQCEMTHGGIEIRPGTGPDGERADCGRTLTEFDGYGARWHDGGYGDGGTGWRVFDSRAEALQWLFESANLDGERFSRVFDLVDDLLDDSPYAVEIHPAYQGDNDSTGYDIQAVVDDDHEVRSVHLATTEAYCAAVKLLDD